METIKLIIWDLDETFWKGTLSEEGIEPIQKNIDLIKTLTDRGIINSVVSKNNADDALNKLKELGIVDLFIFPTIAWEPKGKLIKEIIEKCQLRPINVLFLDDNHLNLEEAKFYNTDLNTSLPSFIDEILTHPSFIGKDDTSHSRLKQYKILEKKNVDVKTSVSNEEFLKNSAIKIKYIDDLSGNTERIHELIDRSNQLNFTKNRISIERINILVNDPEYKNGLLSVNDKYGDYGIVGFYSLHLPTNVLEQFVFSCRILNLGIEQYIFASLGFPKLTIVPDVVSELKENYKPDWITIDRSEGLKQDELKDKNTNKKINMLFVGGCDLSQMLHYLKEYHIGIIEETNYIAENNFPIHKEHSQILVDIKANTSENISYLANNLPFIDDGTYVTSLYEHEYDIFLYSVLMDYTQNLYKHKANDISVPFGGYNNDLTDTSDKKAIIERYSKKKVDGITTEFLDYFNLNFEATGQISPEKFRANLEFLRAQIPAHIPMVFLNGSEIEFKSKSEPTATNRHLQMNKALEEFIGKHSENCYLLDVRTRAYTVNHITDNIRHYQREVYLELSKDLIALVNNIFNANISKNNLLILKKKIRSMFSRIKSKINK